MVNGRLRYSNYTNGDPTNSTGSSRIAWSKYTLDTIILITLASGYKNQKPITAHYWAMTTKTLLGMYFSAQKQYFGHSGPKRQNLLQYISVSQLTDIISEILQCSSLYIFEVNVISEKFIINFQMKFFLVKLNILKIMSTFKKGW